MTTRNLIQVVEIDIERCSLSYGNAPCTAVLGTSGVRKCYNTFKTCQDTANFTREIETLRFAMNEHGFDVSDRIYPCMTRAVSTNPAKINLGGVNDRIGPLGKRARVTINLSNFRDPDIWFDRYQSERVDGTAQTDEGGYNPADRGTFFSKLRNRFPYYVGRPLRVLEGEVGQALSAMRTRHYVITGWVGPNASGDVEIIAKDVLDLAENKKALCPIPNVGLLEEDIDDTSLAEFDLIPAGVGSDYETSGRATIGSEVVSFTRSGDTITLTARGLDGSTASTHDTNDLFQQSYRVEEQPLADIAYDLLINYANIDPSFIDLPVWQAEGNKWLAGFNLTTTIPKPTGVQDLLGELAQMGVIWWWDDINQKIVMRANRPLDSNEIPPELDDATVFVEKSTQIADLDNERLSRVLYYHGIIDVTRELKNPSNYRRTALPVDLSAESDNEYAQIRLYEVFNRWIGVGNDSIADAVAARLVNRYRDTPVEIMFSFDAKDINDVVPAKPVEITSYLIENDTGLPVSSQFQITSLEDVVFGHRYRATAQTYEFEGRYGGITENSRPTYPLSTDDEKRKGTYIVDENTLLFGDGTGPYLMF